MGEQSAAAAEEEGHEEDEEIILFVALEVSWHVSCPSTCSPWSIFSLWPRVEFGPCLGEEQEARNEENMRNPSRSSFPGSMDIVFVLWDS
jgi:hypothetical protein